MIVLAALILTISWTQFYEVHYYAISFVVYKLFIEIILVICHLIKDSYPIYRDVFDCIGSSDPNH